MQSTVLYRISEEYGTSLDRGAMFQHAKDSSTATRFQNAFVASVNITPCCINIRDIKWQPNFQVLTRVLSTDSEYWNWWWQNYSYWYCIQSGYGWQQSSHGDYDNQYRQWLEYFNSVNTQENTHSITQPIPVVQRTRLRLIGNTIKILCVK